MDTDITPALIDDYINGTVLVPLDPHELGRVLAVADPARIAQLRQRVGIEMNIIDLAQLWAKAENVAAFVANANRSR